MLKIGKSMRYNLLNQENFELMATEGIECIEIVTFHNEIDMLDFAKVKSLSEKYSIDLWSLHLPFAAEKQLDASSLNESVRAATLNEWCKYIEKGAEFGIKTIVLHPSCGAKPYDELRPLRIKSAQKTLKELADFAEQNSVILAVENLPRMALSNTIESLAEIVSADNRLKICFDTNHLLTQSNIDFINFFGDRIHTIHVSDYDKKDEKHWLPGEGVNDWQAIYHTLLERGYCGPWMYEVNFEPSPNWFIERPRRLYFKDFTNNANQIFENKPFKLKDQ